MGQQGSETAMSSYDDRVLGRSVKTAAPLDSAPVLVTVEPGRPGLWLVRSNDNRFGGTFANRKAAVIFARDEATGVPNAVVIVGGHRAVVAQGWS
jgi:hypothetical protein